MISARIGAAAFLPKPCEPKELIAVVARLLRFDESKTEGEARRRPSS